MKEIWKNVIGDYYVSNLGNIKRNGKELKKALDRKGYYYVNVSINGKVKATRVHRLVAQAFIPNPLNKREINHIDGNKINNVVNNLEWATHQENMKHASNNGLISKDGIIKSVNCAIEKTKKPIYQIKNGIIIKEFDGVNVASRETNIKAPHISNVLKGIRKSAGGYEWKYK